MKGGGSMLLIGVGKPKPGMGKEPTSDDESEDPAKEGRLAASKALIKALKAGDEAAVDDALQTHYELCAEGKHVMSDEDEDEY